MCCAYDIGSDINHLKAENINFGLSDVEIVMQFVECNAKSIFGFHVDKVSAMTICCLARFATQKSRFKEES